jgi:hypothetical protein
LSRERFAKLARESLAPVADRDRVRRQEHGVALGIQTASLIEERGEDPSDLFARHLVGRDVDGHRQRRQIVAASPTANERTDAAVVTIRAFFGMSSLWSKLELRDPTGSAYPTRLPVKAAEFRWCGGADRCTIRLDIGRPLETPANQKMPRTNDDHLRPVEPPRGPDQSGARGEDGAPRVFVPCPACGHTLELPQDRSLPDSLICDGCRAVLQRPALLRARDEAERHREASA